MVVDGVVELLLAHALALDVAEALGPAVAVRVQLLDHVVHAAHGLVVELVAQAVVAGPAPHAARARSGTWRSRRCSRRPALAPKYTLPSVTTSCTTLPLSPLISSLTSRSARRWSVDRLELAGGDARERGVLAVGREQPRVVGEAGAEEADARHGPGGRGVLLALGRPAHARGPRRPAPSRRGSASTTRSPARAAGRPAGRRGCAPRAACACATLASSAASGSRSAAACSERAPRRLPRRIRPPPPRASSCRRPAPSARSAAARRRPCRTRCRRSARARGAVAGADMTARVLRAAEARPGGAARALAGATNAAQSCACVGAAGWPCSRNTQPPAVNRRGVGQVEVAGRGRRSQPQG